MQKKEKLQKLANDVQKWFAKTPNFIAYNAIGAAVHVNNGQLPEIKFQKTKKQEMVIDVNGLENVKKWQDVPKEIVITYNPYRLKQVGIADPEQYLQESLASAFEQEYPVFSENHRVSLATKPQNNDLLSFYVQTGEKSRQPIYFKHTFNTVEQLNTYLQSRKIKFYQQTPGQPLIVDDTMLKQQYLSSQKGPIGKGISLPRPLNAPPFQDKGAMNNPDDLLQQTLIDKKYDLNTIQGVIQSVGKNNFFSDKNQSLDGINVEYNWSTDDKKQYKSLTTFSDINYDEHQGCFPIIREMLQVVLTEKQFKKVKYSKIKKQIILPKDAFEKDNGTNYDPIKGSHNVDILYKDYIYKVLDDISNQHGLFSKPLSQKELIFFAIERIKADYQAARFYFKEQYDIYQELIAYSKFKGHYIDGDSSTGMKFQNHTYINLKPLFNQGGKPIKSVHVKNGNDWSKVNLNSDYDLSQEQLDKLTNLTEVYVKGGEPLNKHTYKDDCEITNHHLDIYRNAAMLAALDGRYFPSQDKNQDQYYLTHAHWFTLFKINHKKLLDYVEKEPYAAQHSFNNNNYNPYQIEQITINNNEQQTCRKITPNKKTKIADDDEIIKRLLNLGFAGIPLNANVDFDDYCSQKLTEFYFQMAKNPLLPWNAGTQACQLEPQLIMRLLIRAASLEGFNLNDTIRHFAQRFDTYKQGNELSADDVIGNKICKIIDDVVRATMRATTPNPNLNPQNIIQGQFNNNNGAQPPQAAGTTSTTTTTALRSAVGTQGTGGVPNPNQINPPAVPPPPASDIVLLAGEDESQDIFVKIDGNGNVQVTNRPSIGTSYTTVLPPNYLYLFFDKLSQINVGNSQQNAKKLVTMIDNILNSNLPLDITIGGNAKQLIASILQIIQENIDVSSLKYREFFEKLQEFLRKQELDLTKINFSNIEEKLKSVDNYLISKYENLFLELNAEDPLKINSSFCWIFRQNSIIKLLHVTPEGKCLISINGTYFNVNAVKEDTQTVIKFLVDDNRVLETQEIDITNARPPQEVAKLDIVDGKIKINPMPAQVQNIIDNGDSLRTDNNVNLTSGLNNNTSNLGNTGVFSAQTNFNSAMQKNTDNNITVLVRVAGIGPHQPIMISISPLETGVQLKNKIKEQLPNIKKQLLNIDLSDNNVEFVCNGKNIEDDKKLCELNINHNANVFIVLKKKELATQANINTATSDLNNNTNNFGNIGTGTLNNLQNIPIVSSNIQNQQIFLLAGEDERQDIFVKIDGNGNVQVTNRPSIGTSYTTVLPPNYLYLFFEKLNTLLNKTCDNPDEYSKGLVTMIDNILNSNLPLDIKFYDEEKLLITDMLNGIKINIDADNSTYRMFFGELKSFLLEKKYSNINACDITNTLKNTDGWFITECKDLYLKLDTNDQQQPIIGSSFAKTFPSGVTIKLHKTFNNKCLISINGFYFNVKAEKQGNQTVIKLSGNNTLTQKEINITDAQPPQEVAQLDIEGGKIKVEEIKPVKTIITPPNSQIIPLDRINNANNTGGAPQQNDTITLHCVNNDENVMNNQYMNLGSIDIPKNQKVSNLKNAILTIQYKNQNNQNTSLQAKKVKIDDFVVCKVLTQQQKTSCVILNDKETISDAFGSNTRYVIVPKTIKIKIKVNGTKRTFDYPVIIPGDNGKDMFNTKSFKNVIEKTLEQNNERINTINFGTGWFHQQGFDMTKGWSDFFKVCDSNGDIITQKINKTNKQYNKGGILSNITNALGSNNFDPNATGMQNLNANLPNLNVNLPNLNANQFPKVKTVATETNQFNEIDTNVKNPIVKIMEERQNANAQQQPADAVVVDLTGFTVAENNDIWTFTYKNRKQLFSKKPSIKCLMGNIFLYDPETNAGIKIDSNYIQGNIKGDVQKVKFKVNGQILEEIDIRFDVCEIPPMTLSALQMKTVNNNTSNTFNLKGQNAAGTGQSINSIKKPF